MKTLSLDLRERIVAAYERGEGTRQQIAARYNVSEAMVKKLLQQWRSTGDLRPRHYNSGAKAKITSAHEKKLRQLIAAHPDMTLEELRAALGLDVTPQAVFYALQRLGLPLKKRRSSLPS